MSELYIQLNPFKGTWCVQSKRSWAVHPFSSPLQHCCLQTVWCGSINHQGLLTQNSKEENLRGPGFLPSAQHLAFHEKSSSQAGILNFPWILTFAWTLTSLLQISMATAARFLEISDGSYVHCGFAPVRCGVSSSERADFVLWCFFQQCMFRQCMKAFRQCMLSLWYPIPSLQTGKRNVIKLKVLAQYLAQNVSCYFYCYCLKTAMVLFFAASISYSSHCSDLTHFEHIFLIANYIQK